MVEELATLVPNCRCAWRSSMEDTDSDWLGREDEGSVIREGEDEGGWEISEDGGSPKTLMRDRVLTGGGGGTIVRGTAIEGMFEQTENLAVLHKNGKPRMQREPIEEKVKPTLVKSGATADLEQTVADKDKLGDKKPNQALYVDDSTSGGMVGSSETHQRDPRAIGKKESSNIGLDHIELEARNIYLVDSKRVGEESDPIGNWSC